MFRSVHTLHQSLISSTLKTMLPHYTVKWNGIIQKTSLFSPNQTFNVLDSYSMIVLYEILEQLMKFIAIQGKNEVISLYWIKMWLNYGKK